MRSAGSDAAELSARCGLFLDPWQRLVLDVGMGERVDGTWAAADVDLIASRQNGKNGTIECRELYGAAVLGEWIIHTAHLFKTTKESYNRLLGLVEADPDVNERLTYKVASPASGYEMRFSGGGRVIFIARSRTSGRGLTGDVLVFDEAQELDDDALGALLPTISSKRNSQSWYLGSAPGPDAYVWHRRRSAGRSGTPQRRAYFEFSADPEADLDDRGAWAQANPGLGLRQTEEAIEAERQAMSDEMFARERLSISPDPVGDGPAFVPADVWDSLHSQGHKPTGQLAYALDIDTNSKGEEWCSIAVSDGTHLELVTPLDAPPGTSWVVPAVVAKRDVVGELLIDPSGPAGKLIPALEAEDIPVRRVVPQEIVQACMHLKDRIDQTEVRHLAQPRLTQAIFGVRLRDVGDGAWRFSRKRSPVDISPLMAVTLACWGAQLLSDEEADFFVI